VKSKEIKQNEDSPLREEEIMPIKQDDYSGEISQREKMQQSAKVTSHAELNKHVANRLSLADYKEGSQSG